MTTTTTAADSSASKAPSSPSGHQNAPNPVKASSGLSPNENKPKKKRKRSSPNKADAGKSKSIQSPASPAPSHILVIDNGGDTLKYGFVQNGASEITPRKLDNVTARLQHQWTVLVGDEVKSVAPNQSMSPVRSTERGYVVNLGNQTQVWKRLLDKLSVTVATANTEAGQTFGWNVSRKTTPCDVGARAMPSILPQTMAVLLLVPPFCPRNILEQMFHVWFHDFGVAHVGFAVSSVCAAARVPKSIDDSRMTTHCRCVVDVGWSAMHIVPTYRGRIIDPSCIRRVNMGGRHLINIYKHFTSYRQWNLMDQEFLLKDVLESLGYVSLQFEKEMQLARQLLPGKRPYDRDYVLPDYQTTHKGRVVVPAKAQQRRPTVEPTEPESTEPESTETNGALDERTDEDDDDSQEDETEEHRLRRILRQRQDEERRRRQEELEQQVLHVSTERFAIPEILFRPSDAGLSTETAGLPQAVCAAISSAPPMYRVALYESIYLTGGLSHLSNIEERLRQEIRSLAPCQYTVHVETAESPTDQAWHGARQWTQQVSYAEWSVSRQEWESSTKKSVKAWHRLLYMNGGPVV